MELEGTTENAHFDRAAFKVARIYATLSGDGTSLNLKLMPEEQEFRVMMAPAIFSPIPNAWGKQGWTTVDVGAIGTAELRDNLSLQGSIGWFAGAGRDLVGRFADSDFAYLRLKYYF